MWPSVLRRPAFTRYSAPGIRPGRATFFLLAKRKKAKKALQFNTMVLYTSAITTAVTHSPARRAQTAAYMTVQNAPSLCRLRRLLVQAPSYVARAKSPDGTGQRLGTSPVQQPHLQRRRWVITPRAKCRLSEPARRASRYSQRASKSCIST